MGRVKGASAPFFCCDYMWDVYKERDTRYSLRYLHGWRRSGDTRPRRAAIVPRSLRCARDLKRCAALPRPSPLLLAAPLPLAAARGCGLRLARLNPRFGLRARAGAARSGGARRPLALGVGCALACRRGWRGLGLAALRLGLRVLALAPLRKSGVGPVPRPLGGGGPSGFPRRALSRLSLPPRGGAALGLSPSLAALGLRPAAWVRSAAAAPVRLRARGWGSAGCGQRGRPARSRGRVRCPTLCAAESGYAPFSNRQNYGIIPTHDMSLTRQISYDESQETCYIGCPVTRNLLRRTP